MRLAPLAFLTLAFGLLSCSAPSSETRSPTPTPAQEPLILGTTFTIESAVLGEVRRINVFVPTEYGKPFAEPLPVLYMPDGGLDEDFLHVAGLVQVLVSNGGMRPFVLVGIQNTVRRRDLTGPTTNAEDRKIAPVVGGSAAFRRFIREELKPAVRSRFHTTGESAIIGESLAGLFVVETFFLEPELFDHYAAIDPSVWWSDAALVTAAEGRLFSMKPGPKGLFVASSDEPEMGRLAAKLAGAFAAHPAPGVRFTYVPFPAESHATIYHPAALVALRTLLAPPPEPAGR